MGVKIISGFAGDPQPMDGVLQADIQIGPTKMNEVEFQVCPKLSVPILGIYTLSKMGFTVDCKQGTLCDPETGKRVQCSVVNAQKN